MRRSRPACSPRRATASLTVDGLEMLVGRLLLAHELFFGAEPPRDRDMELRELLLTS